MEVLAELNRYLHYFSLAMWTSGTILIWMIQRNLHRMLPAQACAELPSRKARATVALGLLEFRLWFVTIPSLVIALTTGAILAVTFALHEHVADLTPPMATLLAARCLLFALAIIWGVWIHWRRRPRLSLADPIAVTQE